MIPLGTGRRWDTQFLVDAVDTYRDSYDRDGRMGRGMTIAVLCAAGVGSVGGGLTALRVSPESSSTQPVTRPIAGSAAAQPAPNPATGSAVWQPHSPDPHAVLVVQMQAVLVRVAEWSRSHAGAPCPDATVLGIAALDPWGHAIELTCTDQPGDQIMGAISAGPDGIPGNSDDVKSWNLGPGVTQLVQGPRWRSTAVVTKPPPAKRRKDASSTNIAPPAPIDAGDDIPSRR
jgi:hypothetical protein